MLLPSLSSLLLLSLGTTSVDLLIPEAARVDPLALPGVRRGAVLQLGGAEIVLMAAVVHVDLPLEVRTLVDVFQDGLGTVLG